VTLLDIVIRSSVVVLAALAASARLRRQSAAVRHWVLAAGIFSAAAVLPLSLILPDWRIVVAAPVEIAATARAADASLDVTVRPARTTPRLSPARAAALMWGAGSAITLAAMLVSLVRLRRLTARAGVIRGGSWQRFNGEWAERYGLRQPVALLETDSALLATWGWLTPRVLLPLHASSWDAARARVVLGHELGHVQRRDWAVQVAAECVRAAFWFNPLFWVACSRLRQESDLACDDLVLEAGVSADDYASHLVDIARSCRPSLAGLMPAMSMARPSTLERRITAMLNRHLDRHRLTPRTRLTAAALLLLSVAIPAATLRLSAQGTPLPLTGTVYDASGAVLPQARLVLEDAQGVRQQVMSDSAGRFEFENVAPGRYILETTLLGFNSLRYEFDLRQARDWERTITMQVGTIEESIHVTAPRPQSAAPASDAPPLRVGGNIKVPTKIVDVKPIYPESMRATGQEALVVLDALIGIDGTVTSVRLISPQSHPDFADAAMAAVRQWRFSATLLNGAPIEVMMKVSVRFSLD